jgi:hypothetical protein
MRNPRRDSEILKLLGALAGLFCFFTVMASISPGRPHVALILLVLTYLSALTWALMRRLT